MINPVKRRKKDSLLQSSLVDGIFDPNLFISVKMSAVQKMVFKLGNNSEGKDYLKVPESMCAETCFTILLVWSVIQREL